MIKKLYIGGKIKVGWHIDHWLIAPLAPYLARRRWGRAMRDPSFRGISSRKRKEPLIVSLTSFPARISIAEEAIKTLLTQTLKPDKLILFLSEEEFPEKEGNLPGSLKALIPFGLSIEWTRNLRSFKKLVPALLRYPEAAIITADDDILYHPDMVRRLYAAYRRDGWDANCIYCHRPTKVTLENGEISLSVGGYDIYEHPSRLNMPTGVGGVLYPPHSLDADVTRDDVFMELLPTNDDVWFYLMGVRVGRRAKAVGRRITTLPIVADSQAVSLISINRQDQGDGRNRTQHEIEAVLDRYPDIREKLEEEWRLESHCGRGN